MPQSIQDHPNSAKGKLMLEALKDLESRTIIGYNRAKFLLRGMGLTNFQVTKKRFLVTERLTETIAGMDYPVLKITYNYEGE